MSSDRSIDLSAGGGANAFRPRIYALGGGSYLDGGAPRLHRHLLRLTGKDRPRVCFVPTASGDAADYICTFREFFEGEGAIVSVYTITRPSDGVKREALLEQDIIYVGGGNTARMLELWRGRGIDKLLREAAARGTILGGTSAGMNCWFEACVTDSFGPLSPLNDGLGFLRGSACPHVDTEPERMPTMRRLIADGFPAGYALDDAVALWFDGTAMPQVLGEREGSRGWRVRREGSAVVEEALEVEVI